MPEPTDTPLSGNGIVTENGPVIAPDGAAGEALDTPVESAPTRRLGVMGWLCIGWMALIVGGAVLAPILPLNDPSEQTRGLDMQGPVELGDIFSGDADWTYPLGVDDNGRDVLSRTVFGARASLVIGFGAIAIGLVIGGGLGLAAGYFRGWLDNILSTFFNVLLAIPALVLALALIAIYAAPPSPQHDTSPARRLTVIIIALGIVSIPSLGRITRASTISWSEREFVKAAEVAGAKSGRIMVREVLPNVLPAMFSIALLGVAVVIVIEGSLSILGIGVEDGPSWGNMIAQGRSNLSRAPHIVMVPSAAIFLTVLSLNYLGDVIRARFDVRESVL